MEPLHPIRKENNIAIVFSTNVYFVPYMAVMIQSIMDCASPEYHYDIIVLHSEISKWKAAELEQIGAKYNNCTIRLYDVTEICQGYSFFTGIDDGRLSKEAYYRLMIGDILSDEYEKAIYLDGDMVTLVDVAKLYQINLKGYYMASVPDICGIADCYKPDSERLAYRKDVLKLSDPDKYFISGLLVLNLVELRKHFPTTKLLELASQYDWKQHDQDVLNVICNNGKAKMIHASWNVLQDYGANHLLPEPLLSQWYESEVNPFIIHYGGSGKPWDQRVPREEPFWQAAARSEYFETIIHRMTVRWTQNGKVYQPYTSAEIRDVANKILNGNVLPRRVHILAALEEQTLVTYADFKYKPLISVIVPVYKTEKYLPKAVRSLMNQTYENLEIILVDDGSPDNCGKMCDEFAAGDKRIKVIHKKNGGVATARNAGVAAATGEWLGWMDSDDWLEPDMFEYMVARVQDDKEVDIVVCGRIDEFMYNSVYKGVGHVGVLNTEEALLKLFEDEDMRSYLWDKLWRRELFDGIVFPEMRILEDFSQMHKMFARARKVVCLPEEKYHYRQREDSLVNRFELPQTMELLCAEGNRMLDTLELAPQILWRMSIKYTGRIQGIWRDCKNLSSKEFQEVKPLLQEISEFSKEHYELIMKDTYLGKIGKIQVWLTRFPTKWSFALHGALDKVHRIVH